MMINVSNRMVHRVAILYISLPSIIFLFTWLRSWIGIPAGILVTYAVWRTMKAAKNEIKLPSFVVSADMIRLSFTHCVFFGLMLLGWCALAGQGNLVPQCGDWHWRNAVFRDLLTHEWPLVYPKWDRALVFYLGHWLPSAAVMKMVSAFGLSEDWVWTIGNALLLVWTFLGVSIVFMQMLLLVRAGRFIKILIVFLVFTLGDGLNILGHGYSKIKEFLTTGDAGNIWLDSWFFDGKFILAHHGALIYCVFHQAVASWMAVLLLADGFALRRAALLVSLVLICGPLPAIGIAAVSLFLVIDTMLKGRMEISEIVKEAVSVENLIAVAVLCPVVGLYLTANPQSGVFSFAWAGENDVFAFFGSYVLFILFVIGAYLAVTWHDFKKNVWWWAVVAVLFLCPFVVLGEGPDFSMRVSLPPMLILLTAVVHSLFTGWSRHKVRAIVIGTLLVLGFAAPLTNMWIFGKSLVELGFREGICDDIVTFDRDTSKVRTSYRDVTMNCCCHDPHARFFYKYLARRHGKADAKSSDGRRKD